jgi:Dolichyl-phosphate-mannose-protein mannosyltransferase
MRLCPRSIPAFVCPAAMAVAAFGLALAFAFVCAPYPVEWAEGRVFETARRMLAGSPLYCDIQVLPCADLTYPPAYSALVAALGKIFGLGFTAGRAISFAALVWILVSLYRIARADADRRIALAAPAVFLFFSEIAFYAGSMRPDVLSLALVVSALSTLIRRPTLAGTVGAALLLLVGLFVKPQAFAAVSAACIHLASVDRKRLVAFIAVGAVGGALVLGLGQILTAGRFLDHHYRYVAYPSHTFAQLRTVLYYGALPWTIFIGIALLHSVRALRERPPGLVPIYVLCSLLWALPTAAGAGAAANYLFELYVATSLAVAGFLQRLGGRDPVAGVDRAAAVLLSIQVVLSLALNPWIGLEHYLSNRKLWSSRDTMVPALRAAPEPILVEELGLAGYTGHQLFVDSFVATRLANLGRWDERPLLSMLDEGRFTRVVLREAPADDPSPLQRERFTPRMLEAIAAHYRVSWSDGNWFVYEPRR